MILDEGMEGISLGIETEVNLGETCVDTSGEVGRREEEEEVVTPEQAFHRLQEWVTKHSIALTGISAVEAIREARESR
jgi:hypothetical protein